MKGLVIIPLFISTVSASTFDTHEYETSLNFAQVENVIATKESNENWCFGVTIRHNDEGWEHFSDGWEVSDVKGNQLAFRKLHHPHVNEQPFTRSLCNVNIPIKTSQVIVRAKCNKHGFGGKPIVVTVNN